MALAKREARILQTISHVNCVKLLDAFKSKTGRVYLVFEYVEKSIFEELIANPYGLAPRTTKLVTWQLLHAAAYLHRRKIIHRDIKPANILMTSELHVKLCDFGFARAAACGTRGAQPLSSYCVTRWYRPPEVLVSDHYGPSTDIWSIGCTIAEVATGRPLFPGKSSADQLWRIMRCLGPLSPQHLTRMLADERIRGVGVPSLHRTLRQRLPELEPRLLQLLEACLQVHPACRPTAEELLQMPYFWDVPHLVAGTPLERLYVDPDDRESLQALSRRGPEERLRGAQPEGRQEQLRSGPGPPKHGVVATAEARDAPGSVASSVAGMVARSAEPALASPCWVVAAAAERAGLSVLCVDGPVPPPPPPPPQQLQQQPPQSQQVGVAVLHPGSAGSVGQATARSEDVGAGGDGGGTGYLRGASADAGAGMESSEDPPSVRDGHEASRPSGPPPRPSGFRAEAEDLTSPTTFLEPHPVLQANGTSTTAPGAAADDRPWLSIPHVPGPTPLLSQPTHLSRQPATTGPLLPARPGVQLTPRAPAREKLMQEGPQLLQPPPRAQEQPQEQRQYLHPQSQLGTAGKRNDLPVPSTSCPDALTAPQSSSEPDPAGVRLTPADVPPRRTNTVTHDTADAEEDESCDGLSELRFTVGRGPGTALHQHTQPQPHRPLFQSLLVGDAAQAWREAAACACAVEEDEAALSTGTFAVVANSVSSAAITLSSALPAAPGCHATLLRSSAAAQLRLPATSRRAGDGFFPSGASDASEFYASDSHLLRLPGEPLVGLRTAAQRRAAAGAATAVTAGTPQQPQQCQRLWAARCQQPCQLLASADRATAGCAEAQSRSGRRPLLMRGSENGAWAVASASSPALMPAVADDRGGSGGGGNRLLRRHVWHSWAQQRMAIGSRSAQHAAASWCGSFNGAAATGGSGSGFALPALLAGGDLSGSGTPGQRTSHELHPSGSASTLRHQLSHLDTIPLGGMRTPVGAPEMPSCTGALPPHRRPPPSQSPWVPPSRGNSDSLALLKLPFSQRAAVAPLTLPASGQHELAPQQQQQRGEADSAILVNAEAEAGSEVYPRGLAAAWGMVLGRLGRSPGSATTAVTGSIDSGSNRSLVRPLPVNRSRLGGSGAFDPAGGVTVGGSAATLPQAPTSGASVCASGQGAQTSTTPPSAALLARSQGSLSLMLSAGIKLSPVDGGGTDVGPEGGAGAPRPALHAVGREAPRLLMSGVKPSGHVAADGSDSVTTMNVAAGPGVWESVRTISNGRPLTLAGVLLEEEGSASDDAGDAKDVKMGTPPRGQGTKKKTKGAIKSLWKSIKKILRFPPSSAARAK